jgi:hypothetical protein
MRIDGAHGGTEPLRLVGALADAAPVQPKPAPAAQPPRTTRPDADSYDFDTVYTRNLPIQQLTEAHRKLERIRTELVAGKTAVPIHFQSSLPRPANPYIPTHLRFGADPAAFNESATQHAAAHLDQLAE